MKAKGIQIVKILMVRDRTHPYYARKLSQPEEVAKIGFEILKDADREHFAVISLASDNSINAVNIASQGGVGYAPIHPREVFKPAILANAFSICLLHNHTSLSAEPSREDIEVTKQLVKAGYILGINIIDHVIIADNGNFYSLKIFMEHIFLKDTSD